MTDVRSALIIGGGIAGPVAAIALRKAGIDATVFEAYDNAADGVGGGLGFAPNGQTALAAIGAGDIPRRVGFPMKAMVIESWTGVRGLAERPVRRLQLRALGDHPGHRPARRVLRDRPDQRDRRAGRNHRKRRHDDRRGRHAPRLVRLRDRLNG